MELEMVLRPPQLTMAPYAPKVIMLANGKQMSSVRRNALSDFAHGNTFLGHTRHLPLRKSYLWLG
jgi:hypothetical protein